MNKCSETSVAATHTITVFDVCDTLYAQNTTFGFVRYVMRKRTTFFLFDSIATMRWSPLFIVFALLHKLTGKDHLRNIYLRFLTGKSRSELDTAADSYLKEVLEPLAVIWTHAKLAEALHQSQTVCLCSASIDCVINAIARRLGTLCRSSELEYLDDLCTGRIRNDITGKKADIIKNFPGFMQGFTQVRVFTDNFSDIELVKLANEATVILPGGRGKEKWAGCNVDFVYV